MDNQAFATTSLSDEVRVRAANDILPFYSKDIYELIKKKYCLFPISFEKHLKLNKHTKLLNSVEMNPRLPFIIVDMSRLSYNDIYT